MELINRSFHLYRIFLILWQCSSESSNMFIPSVGPKSSSQYYVVSAGSPEHHASPIGTQEARVTTLRSPQHHVSTAETSAGYSSTDRTLEGQGYNVEIPQGHTPEGHASTGGTHDGHAFTTEMSEPRDSTVGTLEGQDYTVGIPQGHTPKGHASTGGPPESSVSTVVTLEGQGYTVGMPTFPFSLQKFQCNVPCKSALSSNISCSCKSDCKKRNNCCFDLDLQIGINVNDKWREKVQADIRALSQYTECVSLWHVPSFTLLKHKIITKCPNGTRCRETQPNSFLVGNVVIFRYVVFGNVQCAKCHGHTTINSNPHSTLLNIPYMSKTSVACNLTSLDIANRLFEEDFNEFERFVFHHCSIYFGANIDISHLCPIRNIGSNSCAGSSLCESYESTLLTSHCSVCNTSYLGCYGIGHSNPAFFSMSILMNVRDTEATSIAFQKVDDTHSCSVGSLFDEQRKMCVPHPCLAGYSFMNHTCFR